MDSVENAALKGRSSTVQKMFVEPEGLAFYLGKWLQTEPLPRHWQWCSLKNSARIIIPKRGLFARGIYCFALAASRFLADKAGFGMTRSGFVVAQNAPLPPIYRLDFRPECDNL
jgi:hypothetical protein